MEFAEMPELLSEYKDKIDSLNSTPLTGNPANILVNVNAAEENQE